MMTTLEVYNSLVTSAPLPISSEGSAGDDLIQIRDIDGLGPVAASISTQGFGGIDGEFETGSSVGKRNIVMTVGFNPDWADNTIESLRQTLYAYFMPRSRVRLVFGSTHLPDVEISGVVESCEPNIFSKDPQMVISILCAAPHFVAVDPTVLTGVTRGLGDLNAVNVDYEGNVETGFRIDVVPNAQVTSSAGEFRLSEASPRINLMRVLTTIDATHNLQINTVPGTKYIRTISSTDGSFRNALGAMDPTSTWPSIVLGRNVFWIQSTIPGLTWTLSYYARYGGL